MKNIRCVVLLGGCLMSAPLTAAQSVSGATRLVQIEAGKSAESQTQSLQYEAQEWGLSTEEYARFEALMKGRRGIQSPGLDPLTTLGIEARSDEERRRLAEKWVQQEFAGGRKRAGVSAGSRCCLGSGSMVRYYRSVWEHSAGWNREQHSAGRHCLCRRKIVARVMPVWLLCWPANSRLIFMCWGQRGMITA